MLLVVRWWQLFTLDWSQPVGFVLGVVEGAAFCLGICNAALSRRRDYRPVGLVTPLCYTLGFVIFPRPDFAHSWLWFVLASFLLSTWALCYLGVRFTFGAASWVSLQDRGPYRFIRHPQSAARLLLILGCVPAMASCLDVLRLLSCVVLSLTIVVVEEGALMRSPEWRSYALRVKSRFIPGLV